MESDRIEDSRGIVLFSKSTSVSLKIQFPETYVDRVTTSHLHEDKNENTGDDLSSVFWFAEFLELCPETFATGVHPFLFDLNNDRSGFFLEIRVFGRDGPETSKNVDCGFSTLRTSGPSTERVVSFARF